MERKKLKVDIKLLIFTQKPKMKKQTQEKKGYSTKNKLLIEKLFIKVLTYYIN